jgi:alanine racemase
MTPHKQTENNKQQPLYITTNNPHQTWLEISKSALDHNSAHYKALIGNHNKLAVVIKGNGYGHGLSTIATLCDQNPAIDWLCVAQLSEALLIDTINKPILVLGYSDTDLSLAVNKKIDFMVDNLEYAEKLNTIGKKYNHQFGVHIKVDTGLSRIGVLPTYAYTFIKQLQNLPYLFINGIYSHFASSDKNPAFTNDQLQQLIDVIHDLIQHNITLPNIHMSNTAAISTISYPDFFNFFRVGLGIYGLGPLEPALEPVLTWKTRITRIKNIPAHTFVGYAESYKTTRPTRIALIPVGYADGYQFRFSNNASVLIKGTRAPLIGRVSMNITIIDVTDTDAQVDDEVILLGNTLNLHNLAQTADIPNVREIITCINPQYPRIIMP